MQFTVEEMIKYIKKHGKNEDIQALGGVYTTPNGFKFLEKIFKEVFKRNVLKI